MEHFIYILQSEKLRKYYTGISSDPYKRLTFHNTLEKGYTSRYRPWRIVLLRKLESKEKAMRVEKKIKSMKSRKYIEKLIKGEYSVDNLL